jgi:hypothetical protein
LRDREPCGVLDVFGRILAALAIGPAVSLKSFAYGPAWTPANWNLELTFVFVGCVVGFVWMLYRLKARNGEEESSQFFVLRIPFFGRNNTLRFHIAHPQTVKLLVRSHHAQPGIRLSFTTFPNRQLRQVHIGPPGGRLRRCFAIHLHGSLFLAFAIPVGRVVGIVVVAVPVAGRGFSVAIQQGL